VTRAGNDRRSLRGAVRPNRIGAVFAALRQRLRAWLR